MIKKMLTGGGIALVGFLTGAFTVMLSYELARKATKTEEDDDPFSAEEISNSTWLAMHLVRGSGLHMDTAVLMLNMIEEASIDLAQSDNRPPPVWAFDRLKKRGFSPQAIGNLSRALAHSDLTLTESKE